MVNKGQSLNFYKRASLVVQNFWLSHMFFLKIAKASHSIDLVKLDSAGEENQTRHQDQKCLELIETSCLR